MEKLTYYCDVCGMIMPRPVRLEMSVGRTLTCEHLTDRRATLITNYSDGLGLIAADLCPACAVRIANMVLGDVLKIKEK